MSIDVDKLQKAVEAVESKIDIMKDEIAEAIEDLSKSLERLDTFVHNIIEKNQKTIYAEILKQAGQEEEEKEE